jgi:16S rRNA (uracil1498-N3)-methyltransferase
MGGAADGAEVMTRYFYTAAQIQDRDTVMLSEEDAHHLLNVLRAGTGTAVELCDEEGHCRRGTVLTAEKKRLLCRLEELLPDHETSVCFTLAFGLLKGDHTDLVLQKATELGAAQIIPFFSERTVVRPDGKNRAAKQERWEKIIRGAAAQSRRNRIPALAQPMDWRQLTAAAAGFDRAILFWEGERRQTLAEALGNVVPGSRVLLVTGPEGGFSRAEADLAVERGVRCATLGPRILRAETAALAALTAAMYEAGEMGGK